MLTALIFEFKLKDKKKNENQSGMKKLRRRQSPDF